MKKRQAVLLIAALGCAGTAVICWRGDPLGVVPETSTAGTGETARADESRRMLAPTEVRPQPPSRNAGEKGEGARSPVQAVERHPRRDDASADTRVDPTTVWPVLRSHSAGSASATPPGKPTVAAELAFRALYYVGIDPEAEKTWTRAVNDPNMPAGVRSDLIEDLNEEGYTDNSHPTSEDLPLILARLELIERLAPFAMDQVNAAAFEEAYKDLLNMYIRLGGEPRRGR